MIKSDRNSSKSRFDNLQNFWRVDCIMYGETILDMIKSDRNSLKCRFTDNLQIFGVYIASCMKTLHVEIGEIAGISSDNWQGAGFGGPLVKMFP